MISFNNTVTITEGQDMVPLETIQYSQLSKWPKREMLISQWYYMYSKCNYSLGQNKAQARSADTCLT